MSRTQRELVICDQPPPLIRGPALVTRTRDTRGERRVMVSNVTSHDGLNIPDLGVRIRDLQTIRANNPLLLSSPGSLS